MKKTFFIILSVFLSLSLFALPAKSLCMNGLNGGIGLTSECKDLNAIGTSLNIGYDFAFPVSENVAIGGYVSIGGGLLVATHPYSPSDYIYVPFTLSNGVLVEFGDLKNKPFIAGFGPCVGIGFVDMDLVLPIDIRFGKFISDKLYLLGQLTYGVSLAGETVYLEPSIKVGYNFAK